jgi:hypothetical protein
MNKSQFRTATAGRHCRSHPHLRTGVRRLGLWLRGRPGVPLRCRPQHRVMAGLEGLRQRFLMYCEEGLFPLSEIGQHLRRQFLYLLEYLPPLAAPAR